MLKNIFSHTGAKLSLLFVLVLSLYFPISFYSSCQNVFRSNLIPQNFDYAEIVIDSNNKSIIINDRKQVTKIVRNINNCPRVSSAEMSFASPPEGLIILHGDESVEVPFFNGHDLIDINIMFEGYYISSEISFDGYVDT